MLCLLLLARPAATANPPGAPQPERLLQPSVPATGPPLAPLRPGATPPIPPSTPSPGLLAEPTPAPVAAQSVVVAEDALTTIALSVTGLNRLQFPQPITSAHTNSEVVDVTLEGTTAIITFRSAVTADVLFLTQLGQFLLRLVPADRPPQTVRIRQARADAKIASSYQSQLASLVEGAYRREPPRGYQSERTGSALPIDGAIQWWLTLRHKGRALTIDEYTVYNAGAVPHSLEPSRLAGRFPEARAVSADPLILLPGTWGRVFTVSDTEGSPITAEGLR